MLPTETAQVYNELGDDETDKGEFQNALSFYTQGIDVKCKDDQLNVELYLARAHSQRSLSESVICCELKKNSKVQNVNRPFRLQYICFLSTTNVNFTISAQILAHSLANLYRQ